MLSIVAAEDTLFHVSTLINCRGRLVDLSTPAVMGVLNITPDSFYSGSRLTDISAVLSSAEKMIADGAVMLDVGGQSTRPGSGLLDAAEEWNRISGALRSLRKAFPDVIISIDTFHSEVVARAADEGADMINDVSGGNIDSDMFNVVAKLGLPYLLMHMKGVPSTMQDNPVYENVVTEVSDFFISRIAQLRSLGVKDILIDPGFGFGKTQEHNYRLLRSLKYFGISGCPVVAGISRKSMVSKILGTSAAASLNGTTALNTLALMNGASVLRVHDVKEAVEAVKLFSFYRSV